MADVQCKEVMLQYYIQCYIQYIQYNNMSELLSCCRQVSKLPWKVSVVPDQQRPSEQKEYF